MKKLKKTKMLLVVPFLLLAGACGRRAGEVGDDPWTRNFVLPEGFAVDRIYSPSANGQGSWVAMTFDDKGRLIASDQYGSLFRVELPPIGADSTTKAKVEKLEFPASDPADTSSNKVGMGFAQGLLWAHNSLYVVINRFRDDDRISRGNGLYRLEDTNGDDRLDKITELLPLGGEGGEHGPHSIILGPDSALYLVAGNHTDLPEMDTYRLPPNWRHDNLLPHFLDPVGLSVNRKEPGGWIAKTDAEGKHWELISAGLRNPYDIAFNDDGELLTYDADMDWDLGLPWYRPTRICHVTSGSEFGWRTGNAKWDARWPDNLPAVLDMGQGSPTGVVWAGKAKFPDKYRNSLLAFDWSFGIIYSVRLSPKGASYAATAEEFASASPLPLTGGGIGPDGALYFLTGGRHLESNLYRIYYKNSSAIQENVAAGENKTAPGIALRREIEQYHGPDPNAVEKVWQYLGHEDRFIRYAARIAIEHQPAEEWKKRALGEENIPALAEAMLALARNGDKTLQGAILDKLAAVRIGQQPREVQINLLRTCEVVLARMGKPAYAQRALLSQRLGGMYPSGDNIIDRGLVKILVAIGDERVVPKTVPMLYTAKDDPEDTDFANASNLIMRNPGYGGGLVLADVLANMPPSQPIYLATALASATDGWTPDLREDYFKWFYQGFGYTGGYSYIGYINGARKMALKNVPRDRQAYYAQISGDSLVNQSGKGRAAGTDGPKGPGRVWGIDTALKYVEEDKGVRDFNRGGELFASLRCADCHRMRGKGGAIGPDLTQLGTRFSVRDMLEAIIEPSKAISDQYASKVFQMRDGTKILGRLMGESGTAYTVMQNPYAPMDTKEIPKKEVRDIKVSELSVMPQGSLNVLNPDELRDLMAYLMAGGNENHAVYKTAAKVHEHGFLAR